MRSKRGKGLGAKLIEGKQKLSRLLYVDFMGGVDVADQKIPDPHRRTQTPQIFLEACLYPQAVSGRGERSRLVYGLVQYLLGGGA